MITDLMITVCHNHELDANIMMFSFKDCQIMFVRIAFLADVVLMMSYIR